MKKKAISKRTVTKSPSLYDRIRGILESAQASVARSVNSTQVVANWLIGREIVEEEQHGHHKAEYGDQLIAALSARLQRKFDGGYSATNLKLFRQFFLAYPDLIPQPIGHTACDQLLISRGGTELIRSDRSSETMLEIGHTACDQSWKPGWLNPNLSWSLYRHLLRVENSLARNFYEIEAGQNRWTARELERQINSLLFERLAKSKDKRGVMRLATLGHEVLHPADIFKDPVVIEFLGLPESPKLVESELETSLLNNLQAFLLELGKGFAFVSRQDRISLEGDHFYIDLVFYHVILKCYVLIDLKVGKLTHSDLGQLQLYVNYFDEERRSTGDNPTIGLILCTDKNDAVVKYTLGPRSESRIFASRYQLHLPSETELRRELRRELRSLASSQNTSSGKKPRKPRS